MRKFLLPLLLLLVSGGLVAANAQPNRLQAREAEWKNYQLPKTNFSRWNDPDKHFVFRVPSDWQQQGELLFTGPHSATLKIVIQKVPEGFSFEEYFAATLQTVKDLSAGSASIITRKTQLQDQDARELVIDAPDPEGVLLRSTSWMTIRGTQAIIFNLKVPVAHAPEAEPFFKGVVQSVIFQGPNRILDLKKSTIKPATVGPINEIQNIVASLIDVTSERDAAITRLAAQYSPPTDAALDLLVDDRPFVRLGAVQAVVRSNNAALTPFLWELLDDREPLVAEAAARGLATTPDILTEISEKLSSGSNSTETIARVWHFLPRQKRNELLEYVFKEIAVHRQPAAPFKIRPRSDVIVTAGPMIPHRPGQPPPIIAAQASHNPKVQMGALMLLMGVPREEFKLPFARILASNYNPLIAVALQAALVRQEPLPVATLAKLVSSADKQVSKLAAMNLAFSANASDIPLIETLASKTAAQKELNAELKLAIKKINFRQQRDSAKTSSERHEIVEKALSDSAIADFAWLFHCEVTVAGCTSNTPVLKRDLAIKPFGENLFPKNVRHYTAIPNPRQTVQNFYLTMHGMQMDSPRAQSNLVLMMGNLRRGIGSELSAPIDAETLIDYTGIDPDSPISLAAWTSRQAPDSISSAQRRAIVLRVKDRARFERLLEKFQRISGSATNLTTSLGIGVRVMAALPALLPITAEAVFADRSITSSRPVLTYSTLGEKQWNGLLIKTIEHAWIDSAWSIEHGRTHLVYLGDTAILTPDLETLRDLLVNASAAGGAEFLADNSEFRSAIENKGDAVYFSDLNAVFAETNQDAVKVQERGAFKFSGSSWENSHQLVFAQSEWSKPLLPFNPKELTAARDLLPASTVAYFLTKLDVPAAWSIWLKDVLAKMAAEGLPNLGGFNLSEEVLAELGPECGVAMLRLPSFEEDFSDGSWAAFCKLKSNKLADAFAAGRLLGTTGPAMAPVELKLGKEPVFVFVRNGFFIVSNQSKPFATPDNKTSLASTRDYSRSAEKVPGTVVAFGGYNLETAIAAAAAKKPKDERGIFFANVIFSLAEAFHSQNFYATATDRSVIAHSSVAMDREGRYGIADFSYLPRGAITFAVIEPGGVPITDHNRVSRLVLKVRAKAPGPIDNIKDDIKTAEQIVEQKSPTELLVTVAARRPNAENTIQLPIKNPELAEYLKATAEFAADKKEVIDQARQIAGNDRDAWSVAQKLADWTHKNLEWKYVVSADPVQTLATREADCSEFSELFVGMARSLGLPARMVSGLAYSGSSFGGHAWVEVWIGRWIELDPTWGTSFVDATHIRNAGNTLLTSAGLKLIELEVIETSRSTAEFQQTPRALAEHLVKAIPAANKSDLEAAIDITMLTELRMGAGAWEKLNEREREQMWSTYRKVIAEIIYGYGRSEFGKPEMRLLHVEEKGDNAEAICLWNPEEVLVKLRFLRRNEAWHLVDVLQADSGLAIVAEHMQPTIAAIEKVRAGEKPAGIGMSDFIRLLLLMERDANKSAVLADELLKAKPKDAGFRFLKALSLLAGEKASEGEKLLRELSAENYAPAVYRLAAYLNASQEGDDAKVSIEMYERYTKLEPYDSRGFRNLGNAYERVERKVEAEAAYRKALEVDPVDTGHYLNLIESLVVQGRFNEVKPLLAAGEKLGADLFGYVMRDMLDFEEYQTAEKFAATEPARMKTSTLANLSFARILSNLDRYTEAERHFNAAALLDTKSTEPPVGLAMLYRKQSRWLAALKAADKAISVDPEDSEGHYQRACALARLRRIREAMASLAKAVELDRDQVEYMVDEEDLKPLSSLPAFKKLIPEPEKPQGGQAQPGPPQPAQPQP